MSERQAIISFKTDGTSKVEAIGFNGMGCTEATAAIEAALSGGAPVARTLKPEADNYESVSQTGQHASY